MSVTSVGGPTAIKATGRLPRQAAEVGGRARIVAVPRRARVGLDPGMLAMAGADEGAPFPALAQRRQGLVRLEEEDVLGARDPVPLAEAAPELEGRVAEEGERGADGEELVVFARRVVALGAPELALEPGPLLLAS